VLRIVTEPVRPVSTVNDRRAATFPGHFAIFDRDRSRTAWVRSSESRRVLGVTLRRGDRYARGQCCDLAGCLVHRRKRLGRERVVSRALRGHSSTTCSWHRDASGTV